MASTLIEASTKKRFASLFTSLEDDRPTEERVLVFKDREDSPNFLVLKYVRDDDGKIVQRGTLEEMNEEEFKTQHAPHADWDKTTLSEYDKKFQDWRTSTLMQKLEQLGEDEL
jgi:hypothetical protein